MEHKELKDVEKGDRVWAGSSANPRLSLRTVEKVMAREITAGGQRFHRDNLREITKDRLLRRRISAVATTEECEEWDANVAAGQARAEEYRRREALRQELSALFGEDGYVGRPDHSDRAEWEVHLYLSEEGVRQLAAWLAAPANTD